MEETERPFRLPRGYRSPDGTIHREGTMRLALAGDEILPLDDPRVKGNRAYLVVLLLARVVTRLGALEGEAVTPAVIEGLYSADLAYLQGIYRELNGIPGADHRSRDVTCPHCGKAFHAES
ncbi:MAG TPA: phage tail assembly protein [Planctomycetota bacterium]|nr:phage tail assembly protein [Planctomycetota bacterium]